MIRRSMICILLCCAGLSLACSTRIQLPPGAPGGQQPNVPPAKRATGQGCANDQDCKQGQLCDFQLPQTPPCAPCDLAYGTCRDVHFKAEASALSHSFENPADPTSLKVKIKATLKNTGDADITGIKLQARLAVQAQGRLSGYSMELKSQDFQGLLKGGQEISLEFESAPPPDKLGDLRCGEPITTSLSIEIEYKGGGSHRPVVVVWEKKAYAWGNCP